MSYALNAVYNNYLTTYTPKAVTRYDTHKKSELRSVYNSIVKLNRDTPWYLPTTSKDTQMYAVNIKENARKLRNTIAQLGGLEEKGVSGQRRAFSSDESIATAAYIGGEDTHEGITDTLMEVKSLASGQENLGLFLKNEKTSLPADTYSFDIAINNMNYEFQFAIDESETNREIQGRLARLINNSNIGIRADVVESDGRSSLRLASESTGLPTGKDEIFSVTDNHTSRTAGAIDYFGLDYISHDASNAVVQVDGKEYSSPSNRLTFNKTFEVELKGLTEPGEPVRIGFMTDVEAFTDNVNHLIGGYNEFIRAAASYLDTQAGSKHLVSEFKDITTHYENFLGSLGLTMDTTGILSMDEELLQHTASEAADMSETMDSLKSYSDKLLNKSNQVSINPMDYVEKTLVAYKNPRGHYYITPYVTSAYSGMMFNSYC